MTKTWRSWMWNVLSSFIMIAMGGITTQVAVSQIAKSWPTVVIFSVMAAAFWLGFVRAMRMAVVSHPGGITVRGLTSTMTIPWSEIERIVGVGSEGSGATNVVIVRRSPKKGEERIFLSVVGGYGILRRRNTLSDQVTKDLNEMLIQSKMSGGLSSPGT